MNTKNRKKIQNVAVPLLVVCGIFCLWQVCCMVFGISKRLLPSPVDIYIAVKENFISVLLTDTLLSLRVMFSGYLIAIPLGFLIAAFASQSKFIIRMILPLLIILMVVPMATLVPELKLFLGVSPVLKVIVIMLQCAPVIAVNSLSGFTHISQSKIDLMKGYGCGKAELFFRVVLPNALPQIFTGLKLGCILCMIASMAADMSVGQGGLGYRIYVSATFSDTPTAFAAILIAACIGVAFYQVVSLVESRIVVWNR